MGDRAAVILGVCLVLGCGTVAGSNWAVAQAHREQAAEARRQAEESRRQTAELADREHADRVQLPAPLSTLCQQAANWLSRDAARPDRAGGTGGGRYQLVRAGERQAVLLDTATGRLETRPLE